MSLSKLGEMEKDTEACHAVIHGVAKNQTQLSDWTTTIFMYKYIFIIRCMYTCKSKYHTVESESCSVMSDSLQPLGLQHTRLLCPLPTTRVYSNSCLLNQWCHPTISSSVVPLSCLQSCPASGSSQMSHFFSSGGQSIGVTASASVLPMNIQDWFPLGWTGGSPCCPGNSQESPPAPQFKSINSSTLNFIYSPTLTSIHDYWKNYSFD